jgi:type III secretory pathway lipoprotein EscJ
MSARVYFHSLFVKKGAESAMEQRTLMKKSNSWQADMRRWKISFFMTVCIFCSVACSERSIIDDVEQKQANEIVAFLHEQGIPAEASKGTGAKAKFSVVVRDDDYGAAVALVTKTGFPNTPTQTFDEIIAQRGLLPDSRDMQALRIDRALAVQLEEMLRAVPGISDAKVVVRQHFQSDGPGASSVSVVISTDHSVAGDAIVNEDSLRQLIAKSLPSVDPAQVLLRIDRLPDTVKRMGMAREGALREDESVVRIPLTRFLFGKHVPADEYGGFVFVFCGSLVLIGILGALLGYWYGFFQRSTDFRSSGGKRAVLRDANSELPNFRSEQLRLSDAPDRSSNFSDGTSD